MNAVLVVGISVLAIMLIITFIFPPPFPGEVRKACQRHPEFRKLLASILLK